MKIFEITEGQINIDVRGSQQQAKLKAYQDAISAGKSEAEAQNAEAAAGNLVGADALSRVKLGDPSTYTNNPGIQAGPSSEAQRQEWMKDPTATTAARPPAAAASQPAARPAAQWGPGVLGLGSRGPEVSALQKKLNITDTGTYDQATKQAVVALQQKLNVPADGAYGPVTKQAHGATPAAAAPATAAPAAPAMPTLMPNQPTGFITGPRPGQPPTVPATPVAQPAATPAATPAAPAAQPRAPSTLYNNPQVGFVTGAAPGQPPVVKESIERLLQIAGLR